MTGSATPYPTEADERTRLANVRALVEAELARFTDLVLSKYAEAREIKKYINDHKGDMDHAEKISTRGAADQATVMTEHGEKRRRNLERLSRSPYFGRVDFQEEDAQNRKPLYIGIHAFHDDKSDEHLVHDWRAPVSSMFYHYETGPAGYDAPEGRVDGEIVLKRQYKIEDGELEFMLETDMNIHDDILQRELSEASDDKMKNIVATIQRDQNDIIRNDETHTLVIQGAAGSGKTSIALHRIAYLLYRFKDTLRSEDILIVSPNNVFAHYISRVLPELGEEMIRETTMEVLADELLESKIEFETFAEQVATLVSDIDPAYARRVRFKSNREFLDKLDEYVRALRASNVRPADVQVRGHKVPADWIAAEFRGHGTLAPAKQVLAVTEAVVARLRDNHRVEVTGKHRNDLREKLRAMLRHTDLEAAYEGFYDYLAEFDKLVRRDDGSYEYADVFPLIYLKMQLEDVPARNGVKHLVVDEMQDYSALQYRVLSRLFPCRKTILGDRQQSVNPLSSSSSKVIAGLLPDAECVNMNKSYRSTMEITRFALGILPNPDIIPIERHGETPDIVACEDVVDEIETIREWVAGFAESGRQSLGIICKTQLQAELIFDEVEDMHDSVHLLDAKSTVFEGGVIVATAHLVKGLEFDEVVVPEVTADNYRSDIDRQMLYVACTRAMHRLRLTHTGEQSFFLD
ncbi:MAG: UvrD-helicase domain-containing protein [Verrucomicrobiales bacterium]